VPQLMEIAAGEHEVLRDQFVRIKAIEALGRLPRPRRPQSYSARLAQSREGLAYVEPAGLRRRCGRTRWRSSRIVQHSSKPAAAFGAPGQSSSSYVIPAPATLESLWSRHFAPQNRRRPQQGLARVQNHQPGAALILEFSAPKLSIGDSIKLEVRTGLRKINFHPPVVRNIGPDGSGVEFVHMAR